MCRLYNALIAGLYRSETVRELFNALTASLPTVATSPLALVAYLITVVSWVVISFRVRRNKQLLAHIKDFPERDRAQVFRDEIGSVKLKEGLSPEQYLRSKIHQYYFYGFAILALVAVIIIITAVLTVGWGKASFRVGLAAEGPETENRPDAARAPIGKADPLYEPLGEQAKFTAGGDEQGPRVKVESDAPPAGEGPTGGVLSYVAEQSAGVVEIKPELPYLSLLEKGGPIDEDMSYSWRFPKLAFNVVNNTKQTLLVTGVTISVKSSRVNGTPVLRVRAGADSGGYLFIRDDGWGTFTPAVIRFGVGPADKCDVESFGGTPHTIEIQDVPSWGQEVDIKPFIPPGLAGKPEVCAFGRIEYRAQDTGTHAVKFRARVGLLPPPHYHMVMGPSYTYCVVLDADKSGYTKELPVSHAIKPGDADLFHLRVASNKSARYKLSFAFNTADGGQIRGNDVVLNTFVPRRSAMVVENCKEQYEPVGTEHGEAGSPPEK